MHGVRIRYILDLNYILTFNRYYMRDSSYFTRFSSASDGLRALWKSGMCGRPRTPTVNKRTRSLNLCFKEY